MPDDYFDEGDAANPGDAASGRQEFPPLTDADFIKPGDRLADGSVIPELPPLVLPASHKPDYPRDGDASATGRQDDKDDEEDLF